MTPDYVTLFKNSIQLIKISYKCLKKPGNAITITTRLDKRDGSATPTAPAIPPSDFGGGLGAASVQRGAPALFEDGDSVR